MRYQTGDIVLEGWKIVKRTGAGVSSEIYEIQKEGADGIEKAALKVIRLPQNVVVAEALREEVRMMEAFRECPQIVGAQECRAVNDLENGQTDVLIRMELLMPFEDYQSKHDLTEVEIHRMAVQLARALVFLEERNVIHCNIRPQNLFISKEGNCKLGNFNVACTGVPVLNRFSPKGTIDYMAPEVYLGKGYNKTVNIYSLGLVLYEILNKNLLPFYPQEGEYTKEACQEALEKRMAGQTPELPAKASLDFGQIILKMCAYRAQDRYQSAEDLLRALEGIKPSQRIVLRRQQTKPVVAKEEEAKWQENASSWQRKTMQSSEIPWRNSAFMEEEDRVSDKRNRNKNTHKKRKGFLLGAAAGVVFLGVAVPLGGSFLKNQETVKNRAEDLASTSGMVGALTQEEPVADTLTTAQGVADGVATSTANGDLVTSAADGTIEEHSDASGADESLETGTPATDWTAVDELDASMSDQPDASDVDVEEVPDRTEFQIIDGSDSQSGANQDTTQSGIDSTQITNVSDSDSLEGSPYVVVKCEDDERYTFLYEEQSTDSKKKLKLRKHNEVIVSEVSILDDVTWGHVTYCGCTGWVQMQFLWGVNDVDRGDWQPGTYFVAVEQMNLRESPSESAESVGKLSYGEEVVIQSFQDGWGEIHYGDMNGFVYMPCLMSYQLGTYIVNTDASYGIHFRNAPDNQNTEVLCDIPNGSALSVSGFSKGWGYTQYNGMDGWVHLSDLYIEYVS
ncbi:MAG: protein kinase [Lachnospiraceae bacterium]|nr:protein kinase [Lachnospiraceae bacterium]